MKMDYSMDLSHFKEYIKKFEELKKVYFNPKVEEEGVEWTKDWDYINIMRQVVDQLERYVKSFQPMLDFEMEYGKSPEEYIEKMKGEGKKNLNFLSRRALTKTWKNKAISYGYLKYYDAWDFVKTLEEILKKMAKSQKTYVFEISNAPKTLASDFVYVNYDDRSKKRLCEIYDEVILDDQRDFQQQQIDDFNKSEYIKEIRNTSFYKDCPKPSDTENICYPLTFSLLFNMMRYALAKSFETNTVEYENDNIGLKSDYYNEKIKNLRAIVKILDEDYANRKNEKHNHNFTEEQLKELTYELECISDRIARISQVDSYIKSKRNEYYIFLINADALKRRINVIDETTRVLESPNNSNPFNKGVSVFQHTLSTMNSERERYIHDLEWYKDTIKLFDTLFEQIDGYLNDINQSNAKVDAIINQVKAREMVDNSGKNSSK